MSKISDVYDFFMDRLEAVLPNHKRLNDPYQLAKNPDSAYRKGFGLRISSGANDGAQISCDIILSRQFQVVITRMVNARELQSDKKALVEKQLIEDLFLIVKDTQSNPNLNHPETVVDCDYIGDEGIEFISTDKDDLLSNVANFRLRYKEDLN